MLEEDMINFAVKELVQIGIVEAADVLIVVVLRCPKPIRHISGPMIALQRFVVIPIIWLICF